MNRTTAALIAVASLLAAALAVMVMVLIDRNDDGPTAGGSGSNTSEQPAADDGPIYVQSEECRRDGASMIEDAERVYDAANVDELRRVARIVAADDFTNCEGSAFLALGELVEAVDRLERAAQSCWVSGEFMDFNGDGEGDGDGTGLDCREIDGAFARVDSKIDAARDRLGAVQ